MDASWQWGLAVVIAVQQIFGPELDGVFRVFTFLADEEFYLLLLPLVLWCVDFGLGARIGLIYLFSTYVNSVLKDVFLHPRPYDLQPDVQLSPAEGHGLPSGHAQSSAVVWGSAALSLRRSWMWIVAAVLVAGVGLSRVYLGVHFPTDVLGGWVVGAAILGIYWPRHRGVEQWLAGQGLGMYLLLATLIPIGLLLIYPERGTASEMGTLTGVGVGLALTYRFVPFSARGPLWQRVVRFLLGGVVLVGLYFGLRIVLPGAESPVYLLSRFARYAAVGLWGSWGAPWLFLRLRLAPSQAGRRAGILPQPM